MYICLRAFERAGTRASVCLLYVCMSVCARMRTCVYACVCLSVYVHRCVVYLNVRDFLLFLLLTSMFVCWRAYVCACVCAFAQKPVCLFVCLSLCMYVCMRVWFSACLSESLVFLSVCMYVCKRTHVCVSVCVRGLCLCVRTCVNTRVCIIILKPVTTSRTSILLTSSSVQVCLCYAVLSVPCSVEIACWESADLSTLLCVKLFDFCHFPIWCGTSLYRFLIIAFFFTL